jgi:hypothetical protein
MHISKAGMIGFVGTLVLAASAVTAQDKALDYSNKWRIEVDDRAQSDGTIQFRLTPKNGPPTDVTVNIVKGRGENDIARDIRDAMKSALDPKAYHVEVDDGEDVLVKKRKGSDFALELVQTTVMATKLDIEKE